MLLERQRLADKVCSSFQTGCSYATTGRFALSPAVEDIASFENVNLPSSIQQIGILLSRFSWGSDDWRLVRLSLFHMSFRHFLDRRWPFEVKLIRLTCVTVVRIASFLSSEVIIIPHNLDRLALLLMIRVQIDCLLHHSTALLTSMDIQVWKLLAAQRLFSAGNPFSVCVNHTFRCRILVLLVLHRPINFTAAPFNKVCIDLGSFNSAWVWG